MWLGKWYITKETIQGIPTYPFKGSIDNLKIWRFYLDAVKLTRSFSLPLQYDANGNATIWLFDEGEGRVIKDVKNSENLILLPEVLTRRPSWEFSYSVKQPPYLDSSQRVNKSLLRTAETICRKLIYDSDVVKRYDQYFNEAQLLFYYQACVNTVVATKDLTAAYVSVVSLAAQVQRRFNLSKSPIQHMCHTISPRSPWIGPNCGVRCVFGKADSENGTKCVCDLGYWGTDCATECPGGALSPCNGHGKCEVISGNCNCELNWRGKTDCSACSQGWTGSDCSVAVSTGHFPTCSGFTGGHFTTFDGAHYNIFDVGELWLVENPSFKAQLRQISCKNGISRCINAIGFAYQDLWEVVIYAPRTLSGLPIVFVNNAKVAFESTNIPLNGGASFRFTSSTEFKLTSENAGLIIRIRVFGRRLLFNQRASSKICKSTNSLCGNCDGDSGNDMRSVSRAQNNWQVPKKESLFIHNFDGYEEQNMPTGAEFGLKLRSVGLSSSLLPHIFTSTYVTIQLWFKSETSKGGALFTYSKYKSFTLIMENILIVRRGNAAWETALQPKSNIWNQVTIVYLRVTGVLTLYLATSKGDVNHETTTIEPGLFTSDSMLALGQWIPGSTDASIAAPRGFVGYLDEIQIWNKELTLAEVKDSWGKNVQSTAPYLAILWKLNEGQGNILKDLVSNVNLYIPSLENAPSWVYSSASIELLRISNVIKFKNASLEAYAKTWCTKNIQASPVGQLCKGLGVGSIEFYYRSCLRIISSFGYVSSASENILAFSDSCQTSLNLNVWPARQMCNYDVFKNSRFTKWIGANCDKLCVFGHSSSLSKEQCVCDNSFWGITCNNVCPGGPLNTCYSHGTCSVDTGYCSCEYNWRGKSDCSICSPGFYGRDCSVAFIPSGPYGVGAVSGNGHFVTLDGLKIKIRFAGELYAYTSSRLNIKIQLRFIKQGKYIRIRCAFVQLKRWNIAIHTSYGGSGRVLVTANGKLINPKTAVTLGSSGFNYRRISYDKYVISGPENFRLELYQRGSHMGVALTMDKSAFSDACGLLAQWKQNNTSRCAVIGSGKIRNVSLLTQTVIDNTLKNWVVPLNESGFKTILKFAKEPHIISEAGSCLRFNDSSLITPPLIHIFNKMFVSVQFYIKARDPYHQGGVVISFALNSTLALTINNTVQIIYESSTYDTKLVLETLQWNQLSLVYWKITGLLQLYLMSSNGTISMRALNIGSGAFPSGCRMGIGIYQVTTFELVMPGFVGWIDELVIWNRRLDAIMVQQLWKVNLDASISGITALWKFNEGSGYNSRDSIGTYDISLPKPPWKTPEYQPSDLLISGASTPSRLFPNKILENKAKQLCSEIILSGPFNQQCAHAAGNPDLFYHNCLEDIAASGSLNSAIESTISLSIMCQVALNLTKLPGQSLCNVFLDGRYDDWVGKNCTTRCLNGIFRKGKCVCDNGYWDNDCSKECPGGAANPCYGHGYCDNESGQCICSWNWRGDKQCKTCSEGWIGQTCSIAISTPTQNATILKNTTTVCTILEDGFVSGFDGSLYTFTTIGEYLMITSSVIEVQIRQVPCYVGSLCVNALAMSYEGVKISVHAPYSKNEKPLWYVSGKRYEVSTGLHLRGISVEMRSVKSYQIQVDGYFTITLTNSDRYFNIETKSKFEQCKGFGGLCGSCSSSFSTNMTSTNGTAIEKNTVLEGLKRQNMSSTTTINDFIKKKLKVQHDKGSDILIVIDKENHKETRKVYGGIYCLHFNFSAIFSKNIINLFNNNTITIQLLTKSCQPDICGGVLLSYASFNTFYISNYRTVHIGIGNTIYDTQLETNTNVWNMISVVVFQAKMELFIYVTDYLGIVRYKSFTFRTYPFVNGGTLAIGLWQPASGAKNVPVNHIFQGAIDEVRVWEKGFDYAVIKQSWSKNIYFDAPSLTGLWKFNEGEGSFVRDSMSKNHLRFPKYPLKAPLWIFSDAPIELIVGKNPDKNNVTLLNFAEESCYNFILSGSLYNDCKNMGNVTLQFYFRACTSAIMSSGDVSHSMDVIIAFSTTCQNILKLPFWPAKYLCNSFPGKDFPNWIGINCTTPCQFGKASANNLDICVCNKGYFGTNCSGICYGGPANTCNQHGSCDNITGECACEINWRGNENCTRCSYGWTGSDCSFAVTRAASNKDLPVVARISVRGRITTFSGLSFVANLIGEYFLIYSRDNTVQVQVRMVECYETFSCVRAIAVRIDRHSLTFNAPLTPNDRAVIWLDNKQTDIDINTPSLAKYGFTITRQSLDLFIIKCQNLSISIRIYGKYLMIIARPSRILCQDTIGIFGDCSNNLLASLISFSQTLNCSKAAFNVSSTQQRNFTSANVTSKLIKNLFQKLKVEKCHGMFIYSYDGVTVYPDANTGYALYFNHTAVISSLPIDEVFRHNEITIDFMVKISQHGVIMSYCKQRTFFITSFGGKFAVVWGNDTFRTNIKAEIHVWNQIVLVYVKSTHILHFYCFSSNGLVQRIDFELKRGDIFKPGGYLAVGGWLPSLDGTGPQKTISFTGYIDQLRIWNRYFHPSIVQQIWNREVRVKTNALKHAWRFNKGQGTVAIDVIGNINLELATKPWDVAKWKSSDGMLKTSFYKAGSSYGFSNRSLEESAKQFCHKLFLVGTLKETCASLGEGTIWFYYRSCLRTIALQTTLNAAIEVVIDFSDYCQSVLNLNVWPAKPLCNDFEGHDFPIWFGPKCNVMCINGMKNSPDTCICKKGFWGKDCANVCPGGAAHPCHDNGECSPLIGMCTCQKNWKGTKTCSACSKGWTGRDCSIATSISSLIFVISGNGQYGTFDGIHFFLASFGEFTLIENPDFNVIVQIRQVPCYHRSVCVNAIAARFSNTTVTLHGPFKTSQFEPTIWINEDIIQLTDLVTHIGGEAYQLNITRVSRYRYVITWKDLVSIYIRIQGRYLSVNLHPNSVVCKNSTGMTVAFIMYFPMHL